MKNPIDAPQLCSYIQLMPNRIIPSDLTPKFNGNQMRLRRAITELTRDPRNGLQLSELITSLSNAIYYDNEDAGWWTHGVRSLHIASKLALICSEISEATGAYRRDRRDDHLPHRLAIEVELADAMIRILDLAGALDLDIGGAMLEKIEYNANRPDHKPEERAKKGGTGVVTK